MAPFRPRPQRFVIEDDDEPSFDASGLWPHLAIPRPDTNPDLAPDPADQDTEERPVAAPADRRSRPRVLLAVVATGALGGLLLALGALPESVAFPGPQAELLFAPLEAAGFPVDAVVCARWVPNERAAALVRRRVVDADHIFRKEDGSDHGASPDAARRPEAARALEDYLTADSRPPLLLATIGLAVGAPTPEELERRAQTLRRHYQPVALHRRYGHQLRLWAEHLPGQASRGHDYADYLLVEQLAAMVPTATHAVGSDAGPYLGHTLSGSRQPVLLDLTEASRTSRPPAVLLAGTLGSGKTMCLQLLEYQAFLQGSRVVDIDPRATTAWPSCPRLPAMWRPSR